MSKIVPTYDMGYKGQSVTGKDFEVIAYEGRKKITIQFECGSTKNTTSTDIKQGRVKYVFKQPRLEEGDEVVSSGGEVARIEKLDRRRGRVKLQFLCGKVKNYSLGSILSKSFTSEDIVKIKVGDVFGTNNHGKVVVEEYKNAHNVLVRFEDGTTTNVQASSLRLGNVGHPTSGIPLGFEFTNSDGCIGTVTKFERQDQISVTWEDGQTTEGHRAVTVKKGAVYYPNFKSVCGIGYFGLGKYKSDKSGRTGNYNKRVYASWQRMIRRCYDPLEQEKPSGKAYKGVKVCPEWHNFQNFANWAEDKEDKFAVGWELDKDMFGTGWLYSPENCTLLPSQVNSFLSDGYSNKSSDLPDGVNVVEPKTKNSKTGYIARCHIDGRREYLGYYDSPEEAAKVYKAAKEGEAKRLADEYKDLLTKGQYDKLYNFTLDNIHRKHN